MEPWQQCSIRLIETGELDPVYNVVIQAQRELGPAWAERFCLTHLMFYNVGTSITLADEGEEGFWSRVITSYPHWDRGQERRHYRAKNGLDSIQSLKAGGPTGTIIRSVMGHQTVGHIFKDIRSKYVGFGEYMGLKWVDFIDVLFRHRVDYSNLAPMLFGGATRGLESIWPGRPYREGLDEIADFIKDMADPFQQYRRCGHSEAETIACAYRTYYIKTTYKFGWDINNLRETLKAHPSKNARALIDGVPDPVEGWS